MLLTNWLSATAQRIRRSRSTQVRSRKSGRHAQRDTRLVSSIAVEDLEDRALLTPQVFWTDGFESAAPSMGGGARSIDVGSGTLASGDYFLRTTDATTAAESGAYSGHTGNLWRAEDVDGLGIGFPAELEWTGIDITGKTGLTFSGLFGANHSDENGGTRRFETTTSGTDPDFLKVEYSIDGGVFKELLDFRGDNTGGTAGNLALDTDDNDVGDGTELHPALTTSGAITIPDTGTTLRLKVSARLGASGEEVVLDNFTLSEEIAGAPDIDVFGNSTEITTGDTSPDLTDHTDFGDVSLASTFDRTYTITNNGSGDLDLTGSPLVEIGGTNPGDFSVTLQPATDPLPATQSTTFTVRFDPQAAGTRTATVSIASDDGDENPYTFDIQGFAGPEIDISGNGMSIVDGDTTPSALDDTDFGGPLVTGGTTTREYTITNNGPDTLNLSGGSPFVTISGGTAPGDFTVTVPPSSTVADSGGTTPFTIEFNPSDIGLRTATVSVSSDDPDESPYTFDIQGTGRGVTFWTDDFENTTPSPTGTRNAGAHHSVPTDGTIFNTAGDYSVRTMDAGDGSTNGFNNTFTSIQGSWYWRAEDTDGTAPGVSPEIINWTGIDISGLTDLQFSGFFGAESGGLTFPSWEDDDYVLVEADTGSGFQPVVRFEGDDSGGTVGHLRVDTDADLIGDGTLLTPDLQELGPFLISGTGTTLSLRITIKSDASGEEFAFDQFSLQSAVAAAPEIEVSGQGMVITDGDLTPDTADDTDFGNVALTGGPYANTFTITNVGTAPLDLTGSPLVVITGDTADFQRDRDTNQRPCGGRWRHIDIRNHLRPNRRRSADGHRQY